MTSTLIVRPVAHCDLNHPTCPFSHGVSKGFEILHPAVLSRILRELKGYVFDEAVISCPNPLLHPKVTELASLMKSVARRLSLFTPVTGLGKVGKELLKVIDELVVISSSISELKEEEERIKGLLSQGFENVAIYSTVTREESTLLTASEHAEFCRKYGIPLRLGELPYVNKVPFKLRDTLVKEGCEVSIPYGLKYGYEASVTFMKDYRVIVLERPSGRACRMLFIDYYGRISKCPFTRPLLEAKDASSDLLRKVIYSECPTKDVGPDYVPEVRISLRAGRDVIIPPDILALLEVIESTNSLRAACRLLGYNPSTYVEKLRSLEKRLGVKLITSKRGGSLKGVTLLTEEGMRILATYRRVREAIMASLIKENVYRFSFEY